MRTVFCRLIAPLFPLVAALPCSAAQDGGLPLEPTRHLRFSTDEGTWMSVDVAPDGKALVFDLLGDLYRLPIAGGKASVLTRGMAFDSQPRFSADGQSIVFVSDRSGAENLWLMPADGKGEARQLSHGEDTVFVSPEWAPDGSGIVVSRTGVTRNRLMELLLYPLDGSAPRTLVNGTREGITAVGAAFGADSQKVYFAQKLKSQQNYYPQIGQYQIAVLDRTSGELHPQTNTQGGGLRPVLSPDGRWLAYASRFHAGTGWRLRDLASGAEHWLLYPAESDDQTAQHASWDLMPGASFTPDSRALVTTQDGKLWSVAIPSGKKTAIPFSVDVDQPLGPHIDASRRITDAPVTARRVSSPVLSPDGRQVAFSALARIWLMDLPDGTPHRLTDGSDGEFQPAWTPDGKSIVYASWAGMSEGGHLWRSDLKGQRRRLTREAAFYGWPAIAPDGKRIAALRMSRQAWIDDLLTYGEDLAPRAGARTELVWLPATGGALHRVMPLHGLGQPHFTQDPERVFVFQHVEPDPAARNGLVSVRMDGSDLRVHVRGELFADEWPGAERGAPMNAPLISPDGKRLLLQHQRQLWLADLPATDAPAKLSLTEASLRPVGGPGGEFPAWSADGRSIGFSLGRSVFRYELATAKLQESVVHIKQPRSIPAGRILLEAARLITMRGNEVLPAADILIERNRIAAVGAHGSLQVPPGTQRLDLHGKTVVPGFLDLHNHQGTPQDLRLIQPWEFISSLAYGVTTGYDTGAAGASLVDYADLIETGELVGPRFFGTGGILQTDVAAGLHDIDDARALIARYVGAYGLDGVKEYAFGDRRKRQLLQMASAEARLPTHTEGNGENKPGLTEIIDGYNTHQHYFTIAPLYRDVVQLLAGSGAGYVPTLLITHGAQGAEEYWYPRMPVHDDAKLAGLTPHPFLDRQTRRREDIWLQWLHEDEWAFPRFAAAAGEVVKAGGLVGVGAHGQRQGMGYHWEMWSLARGMPNHEVLRCATLLGARIVGLDKDLGSIEPGKLADLVVLDADPLADIRNTNTIRYVMKNGVLYAGDTASELLPEPRARDWLRGWQEETPR